jgi:long-chain acyl-CoA synthetase
MAGLLVDDARRAPTEVVIADDTDSRTRAELNARVNRWIALLRGRGLRVGDRVALVTGNRITTFEALLACLHTGLTVVPVCWRLTASEIGYILSDSGSRAVLTDPAHADRVAAAADGLPLALAAVTGDEPAGGLMPVDPLLADGADAEPTGECSGAVMLYTSATTGRPKGVVSTLLVAGAPLQRVAGTVASLGTAFALPARGRVLLVGPWYHAAQVFFTLFPLLRGCGLVLRKRFDAAATLADIDSERITMCHLVPTQFLRLLRLDDRTRAGFDGRSLERVWHGGAACPVEAKRRMIEWWGPRIVEYYAATEAGIATVIDSTEWLARPGSVGRPVPPNEIVVLGPDGAELPHGQSGAVYLRRPARLDFRYHNAPEKTAAAYRAPGLFTVGDLGHLDEDGYLYLAGRTFDTVISGGVNIYPAEIEGVLVTHPAVRDAAVFGVPDEEYGERVLAVVELEEECGLLPDDVPAALDGLCRRHLAGFKRPRSYRVVDRLPREPTGKLNKRALRDPYWAG